MTEHPNRNTLGGFIEALQILAEYFPNGINETYALNAGDDLIYMRVNRTQCPEDCPDGKKLIALGWHIDSYGGDWCRNI
jgi:hypothetical protein